MRVATKDLWCVFRNRRVAIRQLICANSLTLLAARCLQGVCHRDLKLENILLDDCDPPHIKICDFGYSKVSPPAPRLPHHRS